MGLSECLKSNPSFNLLIISMSFEIQFQFQSSPNILGTMTIPIIIPIHFDYDGKTQTPIISSNLWENKIYSESIVVEVIAPT